MLPGSKRKDRINCGEEIMTNGFLTQQEMTRKPMVGLETTAGFKLVGEWEIKLKNDFWKELWSWYVIT